MTELHKLIAMLNDGACDKSLISMPCKKCPVKTECYEFQRTHNSLEDHGKFMMKTIKDKILSEYGEEVLFEVLL